MFTSGREPAEIRAARLNEVLVPGPRRLAGHLFMMITLGHGTHMVDFVRYPCRPGTVIWTRPGQVYAFSGQAGLDATVVSAPAGALPALPELSQVLDDPFAPATWHPGGDDGDAVLTEITQIAADSATTADTPALLRHELTVLALRLVRTRPQGTSDQLRLRLLREVESSYRRTRRVEEYAERLGCSVRTLTRACVAAGGRGAKQLIDDRVVLEAKRLLATTELPVAAIGEDLGFPEATNFGRFFTREAGRPPGEFRAIATAPPSAR